MFSSHALFAHDHSQSRTVSRFAAESVLHAETSEKNANSGNEMNEVFVTEIKITYFDQLNNGKNATL